MKAIWASGSGPTAAAVADVERLLEVLHGVAL
jgi:hypothetical protein